MHAHDTPKRGILFWLPLLLALGLLLAACDADTNGDNGDVADDGDDVADDDDEADDEVDGPAPGDALEEDDVAEAAVGEDEIDQDAFYHDVDLEINVPLAVGGGSDTQARFMAPFLPNYIPGGPSIQVQNYDGAGGTVGNNEFALSADHEAADMVLFSTGSTFYPWVFQEPALELDYTELIGTMAIQTGGIAYVNAETGIEGPEDFVETAQDIDWVAGEQSPDSLGLPFLLAYDMLELDADTVFGFEGRGPARIAFEQEEININWDTTASMPDVQQLIDEGTAVPVFTAGQVEDDALVGDPVFEDLPTFEEVYVDMHGEDPEGTDWDAYKALVLSGFTLQKVMWLHEDAPDEAVEELREGFEAMVDDPDFADQALEIIGDYDLITGEEVDDAVESLLDFPPDLQEYLIDYMVENFDHIDPREQ